MGCRPDINRKEILVIPLKKKVEEEDNVVEEEKIEEKEAETNFKSHVLEEGKYGLVKTGNKRLKKSKRPLLQHKKFRSKNEDDIFKHEIEEHPEDVRFDVYERIPVEDFGVALLRGMGWNPEAEDENTKIYEAQRRPQRLGLGASVIKELPTKKEKAEDKAKDVNKTKGS